MTSLKERKLPRRWTAIMERRFKYLDVFENHKDTEDFWLSYSDACFELERDADINWIDPEEHFLNIRKVFEEEIIKMDSLDEEHKDWIIVALIRVYKKLH